MADVLAKDSASHVRRDAKKSIEYRVIFPVCFAVFLLAGIFERLMPWSWFAPARHVGASSSLIEQAWGAAGTCTAYAFMG
jgi:hypothetical protein